MNSNKIYMILTNGFNPDIRVYKEAKYLVDKNFDVTILCWDRKCEFKDNQEEELDGIKIKRFLIPSKPGTGLKQIFPYFKFILSIKKYLKDKKYSYLHCHNFDGMLVGKFIKNNKNRKNIFDMHEIYNNYSYAKNIFFDLMFKSVLKKSNYIIYVNDFQIQDIKKNNEEKLVFLPNYPTKKYYLPIEKNSNNKIRVNYIGSLRDYMSLKSLALTGLKNNDIEIGFYGFGICYEQLCEEFASTSIKCYGKYDGIKDSGEIYRNTDILYCSYDSNVKNWKYAYPVKLYEAIITHTPIIVTKDTIVGDFVEKNGIGETINYGDEDSILAAINKINGSYSVYTKNIEKISDKYNWEEIVKNLDKIYK